MGLYDKSIVRPSLQRFRWWSNPVPLSRKSGGLEATDRSQCLNGLALSGRILTYGFLLLLLCFLVCDQQAASAQNPLESIFPTDKTSHILVLYAYESALPAYQKITPAFLSAIQRAGMDSGNVFFECLDLVRLPEALQRQSLADTLGLKYAPLKIDLIVTLHSPALHFLLNEARGLALNAPVIFWGAQESVRQIEAERRIIPMSASLDAAGTLERAVELFPKTSRVVFVVGASQIDRGVEIEVKEAFSKWKDRLRFEYTSSESVEEVLKRIAQLPDGSIVIYGNVFEDVTGRTFIPRNVGRMVAERASVPVFALYDTLMDSGIVGGSLLSFEKEGARIGQVAVDVLGGNISLSEHISPLSAPSVPMFDWRQIQRWGAKVGKLVEPSIFTNRPPSLWAQYRWQIVGIAGLIMLQGFFIVSLLIARHRKARVEQQLNNYQELLKALASQLTLTAEKERRAIAADLHDHVGHSLALARMQLNSIRESKSELEKNILVKDVSSILLTALQDTKNLISELSTPSMNEMGLGAAISEWLDKQIEMRHHLETEFIDHFSGPAQKSLDEDATALIFRNVRELLVNVVKHARATKVSVYLWEDSGMLKVVVEDDGIGFDPGAEKMKLGASGGFGLFSIRERMTDLGGTLDIESATGKGCRVTMTAPMEKIQKVGVEKRASDAKRWQERS